ncbi:MAG: hypothetical protein ACLRQI_01330, partial [Hallella bergensis]
MRRILLNMIGILICQLFAMGVVAQNVTISPESGKLIAGLTGENNEVGYERGWSSLWRHNQLPLSLTVSDKADLTEGGMLKDPAGNIILDEASNRYVVCGGMSVTTRLNISLPKGYRFTGYRIVLLNNKNGTTFHGMEIESNPKQLYETDRNFNYSSPKAKTDLMPGRNDTKEYVIERTSKNATDMDNNLYFYFYRENDEFYAATIKSCELYFTAEGDFNAQVKPSATITSDVNMVGSSFATSRLDLGPIKPNTKNEKTFYSYDYRNVKDLTAMNYLYQEDAVAGGKLPETAGAGSIQASQNQYILG